MFSCSHLIKHTHIIEIEKHFYPIVSKVFQTIFVMHCVLVSHQKQNLLSSQPCTSCCLLKLMMSYKSVDRDLDHSQTTNHQWNQIQSFSSSSLWFQKNVLCRLCMNSGHLAGGPCSYCPHAVKHTHKHRERAKVCAFLLLHSHFKWKPGSVCCGSPLLSAFLWLDFDSTGFVWLTLPERLRLQAGEWLLVCTDVSVLEGGSTCWHIYSRWYVLGFHIY